MQRWYAYLPYMHCPFLSGADLIEARSESEERNCMVAGCKEVASGNYIRVRIRTDASENRVVIILSWLNTQKKYV